MRCPRCSGVEDRVMDSRTAEEGAAIRRRRECLACGRRFTTYERLEEVPFVVVKRSGHREPFERAKVVAGLKAAGKNRPLSLPLLEQIAAEVEETLRLEGSEVTSQQVGLAVLDALRGRDDVAYLRFASVYKGFTDAGDFQREAGLLTKVTTPKTGRPAWAGRTEPGPLAGLIVGAWGARGRINVRLRTCRWASVRSRLMQRGFRCV